MKPIRIAVINTVACNGGDAAILTAVIAQLKSAWPNCVITAYDSQPAAAARHHGAISFDASAYTASDSALRRMRWLIAARLRGAGRAHAAWRVVHSGDRRRLSRLARSDIVVSTGGTYLVETYSLRARLFEFLTAHLLRRPLVLYTQTIGPFHERGNRRRMRRALRRASLVFVRDRESREIALDLGAPRDGTIIVPDVVFGITPDDGPERLRTRDGAGPRIAVSVRDITPFVHRAPTACVTYEDAIAAFVTFLVRERGASVDFLSTCQGIADYHFDDSHVATRISDSLPDDVRRAVSVVGRQCGTGELQSLYAGYDAVIATRMHAAILALGAGTPVLPIAYERKTRDLFRELDAPFTIVDAAAATGPALIGAWCEFEESLPRWRDVVSTRIAEWQIAALRPAAELTAAFGGD